MGAVGENRRRDRIENRRMKRRERLGLAGAVFLQFAVICVLGNVQGTFTWGLRTEGPGFAWEWILGGALQLSVVLSLAQLAAAFPVTGACYSWLRRLSHNSLAWLVGYLLLFGYIAAVADDDFGLASSVFRFAGIGHPTNAQTTLVVLVCLGAQVALSLASLHLAVRSIALAVSIQVLTMIGVVVGLVTVGVHRSPMLLLNTAGTMTHEHLPPFLLTLMIPAWAITGFDASCNFAGEIIEPSRTVPRALAIAAGASFILGTALIVVPLLSTTSLVETARAPSGLSFILQMRLGSGVSILFNAVVVAALFFLPVVLLLVAGRLLWAQVRDGAWPGAGSLSVLGRCGVPARTTLLCACLAGLLCVAWPLLYGLGTVWPALWPLAYAVTIAAGLLAKLKRRLPPERDWKLGRWGILNDVVAIVWSVFLVGLLPLFDAVHAVPLLALIVAAGVLGYLLLIKPRWSPAAASFEALTPGAAEAESFARL